MLQPSEQIDTCESLINNFGFMRIPRDLPTSSTKALGLGLTISRNLLIFDCEDPKHYWQKKSETREECERIVNEFRKRGVPITS